MKSRISFLVMAVCLLVGISGCILSKDYYARSFILEYAVLERSKIIAYHSYDCDGTIKLGIDGSVTSWVSCFSEGKDKELYDEICEKNGDITYNRNVSLMDGKFPYDIRDSFYPDLSSIVLTSNKDFDAEHPAGTPLNEYVTADLEDSVYEYVASGYDDNVRYSGMSIPCKMSELTEDNLKMLLGGMIGVFSFDVQPEKPGFQTLTFTCTTVDGDVYTASLDYNFGAEHQVWY